MLGILNVAAPDWESFTPEALALLSNAGSLMGIALERARLVDLLREQRIDEQAALLEFSNQLLGRSQPRDLLDYMVREVRRLLHVDAVALVTPDDSGAALTFKAASRLAQRSGRAGRDHPGQRVQHPGPDHALAAALRGRGRRGARRFPCTSWSGCKGRAFAAMPSCRC